MWIVLMSFCNADWNYQTMLSLLCKKFWKYFCLCSNCYSVLRSYLPIQKIWIICGMNGLFWGKIWLLSGSMWLGMIWPWKKMTANPTDQPYVLSPLSWSLKWAFHNLSTTINNNGLKVQFSHPKTGASRSRPSEWTITMSGGTMLWMAVQVGSADYCYTA